jgi:pantoate--beta-alanine ligase
MGAFHEGHLHLMRTAKEECGGCLASLFVNPTQFGPNEDFGAYPRDEASDFSLAESAGVDLLFAPDPIEIYGEETVSITVPKVAKRWEGEHRPRHFEGVATVVAKLFLGSQDSLFRIEGLPTMCGY